MPIIQHEIYIKAPIWLCFDLARSAEVHAGKTLFTVQYPIDGTVTKPMENGDWVTWNTRHFGINLTLTSKVINMNKPYSFTDEMIQGAFHSFTHMHEFKAYQDGTIMSDTFEYRAPFGLLGKIADRLFLEIYMDKFIKIQAQKVKRAAEANHYE